MQPDDSAIEQFVAVSPPPLVVRVALLRCLMVRHEKALTLPGELGDRISPDPLRD
jgi:hypothetical protein